MVLPLLAGGLLYYYFIAAMGGVFSVPALYSGRLAFSNGGFVVVEGVSEASFRSKGSEWRARYVAPGTGGEEEIGSWFGPRDEFTREERSVPAGSVSYFAPEKRELVVDLAPWGGSIAGRLYFQLSPDGERFELVRVQKPEPS